MIPKQLQIKEINFVLLEKSGKKPFQKDWQNKTIKYDDEELLQHLNSNGNYGVLGGGEKNLVILDFDDKKVEEEVCKLLPKTFTVQTGSGGLHKYFFSNNSKSFKIFNDDMDTLVDVQGEGKQVVGAGSIHPNGNEYNLFDDSDIAFISYSEIQAILSPYNKKIKKEEKVFEKPKNIEIEDDFIDKLKSSLSMKDVLDSFGINTSKNPTECLFHSSKGGKCLGFNRDTAHCFHCIHPEQEIITLDGIKKSKDIKEGDFTINAFGKPTKIKKVTKHKSIDNKILEIFINGNNEPLRITENHGCFYYKKIKLPCGKIRGKSYKLKQKKDFIGKIPAKNLTTNDALFIPKINYEKDYSFLLLPFFPTKYGKKPKIIRKLPLTKNILWMIGMYLAEGNSFRGGIKFSLHKKENLFAERIKKAFKEIGINCSFFNQKTKSGESLLVNVCRTELSYSFKKLFGEICDKKKIPSELLFLPNKKLKYLFKGIMDGDGSKRDFLIKQTSNNLSIDLLLIGRKLGFFCSRSKDKKIKNRKQTYTNYFSKKGYGKIKINANQVNIIKKIKSQEYNDEVIDLTVEGHPSLLTPQGIIGNCDESWNIFSFVKQAKNYSFKEALEYLANLSGLEDELEISRRKYIEKIKEKNKDAKYQLKDKFLDYIKEKKVSSATELIVNYIINNNYIFTTKDDNKSEIWMYENGIYAPNGRCYIKEIMSDILGKWFNSYYFNQVINKIEPRTYINPNDFFNNNYIYEIPVKNGILNILTRELKEFTPEKVFFNKLNVEYNSMNECPQIEKFLKQILSKEEDIDVFYEIGGFCLMKEYKFEKAFMFVGNGRNGKDKSLELIKRLFGVENCCSVPLSSIVPDSFIISEFFGKMINIAGEINNKDLKDTSIFKALTGRSLMSAPRKFLNPITFVNHAKFIFACNELPMVYDSSRGFWDRWVLLEFPYTFVNKEELKNNKENKFLKLRDENIIEKITTEEELSGLLNKFLDGLDRLLIQRDFSSTLGSNEIKKLWIRKSNSVMAFCTDNIEEDYDSFITKKDFRRKYTNYCKKHKIKVKSDYVIKRTLEEEYGVIEENKNIFSENWVRCWGGIKWK
jgi:putative DNA primase/helicase